MNIAYSGCFLREGFRKLGHTVIDIPYKPGQDINAAIAGLSQPVDLVFLELYGSAVPVANLHACDHELAAWLIDSPINEFWHRDACYLFDHIFIDQLSSVNNLARYGITSHWLPLCAQDMYFVEPLPKVHDITFVGTTDSNRRKRTNLLNLVSRHFPIDIVKNISIRQAQQLFAQSKIILNENLFCGLTLRIFQGLASGSLVLTENGAPGMDSFFRDGEHLACYSPDNLLARLEAILASYPNYEEIAYNGSRQCKATHTSTARAEKALEVIKAKRAFTEKQHGLPALWHESRAHYLFTMRYGGSLNQLIRNFKLLAAGNTVLSALAQIELGNIFARNGELELAQSHYLEAASSSSGSGAWSKLALLYIHKNDIAKAKAAAHQFIRANPQISPDSVTKQLTKTGNTAADVLYILAQAYFIAGSIFEPGFSKAFNDIVPETAFEVARMIWKIQPSPQIVELMLRCISPSGLQGEILPDLLDGIRKGVLSDAQILRTAEIARNYYDVDTADTIIRAFKNAR